MVVPPTLLSSEASEAKKRHAMVLLLRQSRATTLKGRCEGRELFYLLLLKIKLAGNLTSGQAVHEEGV
jgi:hypothetical protein